MTQSYTSGNLVDKKWLSQILNSSCNGNGILLDTVSCRIGQSTGFLSDISQHQLLWYRPHNGIPSTDLPTSVLIKKPSLDGLRGFGDYAFKEDYEDGAIIRMHNRECIAYEYFDTFNSKPPIPVPKCYYSRPWSDEDHGLLILEDLSQDTCAFGFSDVAREDQVMAVTEHLANLHAYGHHRKQFPSQLKEPFFPYEKSLDTTISQNAPHYRQHYPDIFKYSHEEVKAMVERVKQPNGVRIFKDPTDAGYPPVICLGDVQRNNILWRNPVDTDIDPTATSNEIAAFIDFQSFHIGNCMSDLAYFTMLCVSPQDRSFIEENAIPRYIAVIQSQTQEDDAIGLSLSDTMKLYKISLFQFSVTFLPLAQALIDNLGQTKMSHGAALAYLERMVAGIECGRSEVNL